MGGGNGGAAVVGRPTPKNLPGHLWELSHDGDPSGVATLPSVTKFAGPDARSQPASPPRCHCQQRFTIAVDLSETGPPATYAWALPLQQITAKNAGSCLGVWPRRLGIHDTHNPGNYAAESLSGLALKGR